jgi:hypothetical protein
MSAESPCALNRWINVRSINSARVTIIFLNLLPALWRDLPVTFASGALCVA